MAGNCLLEGRRYLIVGGNNGADHSPEPEARIADLPDERAARAFLRQNGPMLQEYIRSFVPRDRSLTAVQATPFFRDRFGRFLQQ